MADRFGKDRCYSVDPIVYFVGDVVTFHKPGNSDVKEGRIVEIKTRYSGPTIHGVYGGHHTYSIKSDYGARLSHVGSKDIIGLIG